MTETKRIPEELYQEILKWMPRPCVDIVLKCGDEVLVLRRRIEPLKNFWAVPGGRIYKGEGLESAAVRVVSEELGIKADVADMSFACVINFEDELYGRHDICLTYVLDLPDKPEIKLDYQHRDFKWLPLEKINELGEEIDLKVARQIDYAFNVYDSLGEV